MTYKNSLANLDFGGGKATVNAKVTKNQFYELFAQVLKTLDGTYITAGDIGMVDEDLIELKKSVIIKANIAIPITAKSKADLLLIFPNAAIL